MATENRMPDEMVTAAKKQRPKPTHPTYIQMAKEAICSLADKKGSSIPALQSYIAGKYTLDADIVRTHLKPALAKGLESGMFIRPKNSDAKGYTGRFKVDKAKESDEAKAKKLKEKEKLENAKEKQAKEKVVKKSVVKKTATKKSPVKIKAVGGKKPVLVKQAAVKKTVAKKTPKKSPKKIVTVAEKKPKAAKTLKAPKTPKTLKTAKKPKTPASSIKGKK